MTKMSLIQFRGEVNAQLVASIKNDPSAYKFFLTNTEHVLMVPITWDEIKDTNLTQWLIQEDDSIIVVVPTENIATLFYIYSLFGNNYRSISADTYNVIRMLDDTSLNTKFFDTFQLSLSFDGKIDTSQQIKVPTMITKAHELCEYLIQPKYCVDLLTYDIRKIYAQSNTKECSRIMLCLYIYAKSLLSLEGELWLTNVFENLPTYSRDLIGPYTPMNEQKYISATKYTLLYNSYEDMNEIIKGKINRHEHSKIIKTLLDEDFGVLSGQLVYTSMYSGMEEFNFRTMIILNEGKTVYDVIDRLDKPIQISISIENDIRVIKFGGKCELKVCETCRVLAGPYAACYYKDKLYMSPSCMFSLLTGGVQVPLGENLLGPDLGWRWLTTQETPGSKLIKLLYRANVTSFTKDEFEHINLNL